jgi:integrase/recombinase XerC/integrase/recombinase XerD
MDKVTMPRLDKTIPPPFSLEEIKALLAVCSGKTRKHLRDKAIVVSLLDSGLRASEFVSLRVKSVDLRTGLVTVVGKGRKQRVTRFGAQTRKSLLRYLATRQELTPDSMLWVAYNKAGIERGPLTMRGLEIVCRNLGNKVGIACHPHKFRRTFALWCLRSQMDLHSLRLLMGHRSLAVLQRYLALAGEDIERAHRLHSPVDNLL